MDRTTLLRVGMFGLVLTACGGSEFSSDGVDGGTTAIGTVSASSAVSSSSTGTSGASGSIASTSSGAAGSDSAGSGGSATSGAGGTSSAGGAAGTAGTTGSGGSTSVGGAGGATGDASVDVTSDHSSLLDVGSDRAADAPRDVSQDVGKSCFGPSECPPSTSRCKSTSCTLGTCGFTPMPIGPIAAQTAGDCKRIDCTITGEESIVADDSDSDDRNECTKDTCANGTPSHMPLMGNRCQNGTKVCDAAGSCVECVTAADCTGMGTVTECNQLLCLTGKCTVAPKPAGFFCRGFADQCDGAGNCVDCFNSGGCDECCVCNIDHKCIAAFQGE